MAGTVVVTGCVSCRDCGKSCWVETESSALLSLLFSTLKHMCMSYGHKLEFDLSEKKQVQSFFLSFLVQYFSSTLMFLS